MPIPSLDNSVPLISVITVVFNAAATIEHTILSVITQSFDNFEYLIIDGGSTDGTRDIIAKYNNQIDLVISEKDRGIYDAMNKAVKLANGSFIYFIGADDVFSNKNTLEEVSAFLNSKHVVYYGDVLFKHQNRIYDGEFSSLKLATRNICHQCIFYPAQVFEKYPFKTDYKIFADYYLNILLFFNSSFTFNYINIVVAIFNDMGQSGQQILDKNFEKDRFKIFYCNTPFYIFLYRYLRSQLSKIVNRSKT